MSVVPQCSSEGASIYDVQNFFEIWNPLPYCPQPHATSFTSVTISPHYGRGRLMCMPRSLVTTPLRDARMRGDLCMYPSIYGHSPFHLAHLT